MRLGQDESVQDVLNVREVKFHRCFDRDCSLQREDRVEGRCREPFPNCHKKHGLCDVCLDSVRILAHVEPTTVEVQFFVFCWKAVGFSTRSSDWQPRIMIFQVVRPMVWLRSHVGSCRRSTWLGLGFEDTAEQKDFEKVRLTFNVGVNRSPDNVFPSGVFSSNMVNRVKPVYDYA